MKADKGNRTVVMKQEDYINRMRRLVEDENTYDKLDKDPTSSFQTKNNELVRRLLNLGLIQPAIAMKLKTYKAVCPKIYGLPKAHKAGLPLRPVVPCMTAPSYELSKFVGGILRKSMVSRYNIKDSFEFCDFINSVKLPETHVLVSFDVVSLFTSIPKALVRKSVFKHWGEISKNTDICLDLFWELTEFCIDCSFFSFQGVFYKQKFGTAMGNPLSPIVADLVMEDLLDDAVSAVDIPIPFLRKYVDDLFLSLPVDKVEEIRAVFNQQDSHIQFTVETEKENRLPFLDMMLIRQNDQSIQTEWYMKEIASGRFLNFHSCHPMHQKMNVATNFANRVKYFTTTNSNQKTIKSIIHRQLRLNDYPSSLISRITNRLEEKTNGTAMAVSEEKTTNTFRSLTNINGLTQQVTKTLRRLYPTVKIANNNRKTVDSLLPLVKDKTERGEQSNVVYKISCSDCEACYVGMTTTKLKTRISGHKSNMKKLHTLKAAGYTNSDVEVQWAREKTALVDHAAAMDHTFKLEDAQILDRTHKKSALPILESCHIYTTDGTVNKRTDTDNINVAYAGFLHAVKNIQGTKNSSKTNDR